MTQSLAQTISGRAGTLLSQFLDDRMRVAAELLIAGVAFQTSGTRWNVYSHDGEYIGEISTFIVNETTRALKAHGLRRTSITDLAKGERASVTFGFSDQISAEEMEVIMARRHRKPITMH